MDKENRDAMGIYVPLMDFLTRTDMYSDEGVDTAIEWLLESGHEAGVLHKVVELIELLRVEE